MVNNLGGVSNFEMSILANSVVKVLEGKYNSTVKRLYVGGFMTSFNMQGASISIISMTNASDVTGKYLDAETDALSWVKADNWIINGSARPSQIEVPEITVTKSDNVSYEKVTVEIENFSERSKAMVKSACALLIESEPTLTKYDTIVGDGDCGITMKRGAKEIISRLENEQLNSNHPVALFESLASAVSASMGGTSGILLELMFRKMRTFLNNEEVSIDESCLIRAFEEGVNAVSFYGGATEGSRTMLDALYPAVKKLKSGDTLEVAAQASMAGANETAEMGSASAGRSNYLNEDVLTGTPDPGAIAVALALKAIVTK
jgi:dihydroxyacetone kinase